ncbi:MAG: hypothetical protein H6983_24825 [Ectothiorhodospiraceae bacterium]|nr:hypothetical protein [Ectothiorhodospiraceae bacterium]
MPSGHSPDHGSLHATRVRWRLLRRLLSRRLEPLRGLGPVWLAVPLLAFLVIAFVVPLLTLARVAVENRDLERQLPRFVDALRADLEEVPGEEAFRILADELLTHRRAETLNAALKSLSQQDRQVWLLVSRTAEAYPDGVVPEVKRWFVEFNAEWASISTWRVLRRVAAPLTIHYLAGALDAGLGPDATIEANPPSRRGNLGLLARTMLFATAVTALAMALAYPVAHFLAHLEHVPGRWLMMLLLIPAWAGALVRTLGWVVMLGRQGVLATVMRDLGASADAMVLVPSRTGLLLAAATALVPFAALPCYVGLRRLSPRYLQAAQSLGAPPVQAFLSAHLPQVLPAVALGAAVTYILATGLYTTPLLLARANDAPLSVVLFDVVDKVANPNAAAALAIWTMLLAMIPLVLCLRYLSAWRRALPGASVGGDQAWVHPGGAGRLVRVLAFGVVAVMSAPLVMTVVHAFAGGEHVSFPPEGISLGPLSTLVDTARWLPRFGQSVGLAVVAALLATALGASAALALHRVDIQGRYRLALVLCLPLAVPSTIYALALYLATGAGNRSESFWVLAAGHATLGVPAALLIAWSALTATGRRVEQAALSLGAPPRLALRTTTLPLIAPGLAGAFLAAFVISFNDVVLPVFLAPERFRTLSLELLDGLRVGLTPELVAVGAECLIVTTVVAFAGERLMRWHLERHGEV